MNLVARGVGLVLAFSPLQGATELLSEAALERHVENGTGRYQKLALKKGTLELVYTPEYLEHFIEKQWKKRVGGSALLEPIVRASRVIWKSLNLRAKLSADGLLSVEFHVTDNHVAEVLHRIDASRASALGLKDELETHFLDILLDVTSLVHDTAEKRFLSTNVFSIVSAFSYSGVGHVATRAELFADVRKKLRNQHHDNMKRVERFEEEVRNGDRRWLMKMGPRLQLNLQTPGTLQTWITSQIEIQRGHQWLATYIAACIRHCGPNSPVALRAISEDMQNCALLYGSRRELLSSLRDQISFQLSSKGLLSGVLFFGIALSLAMPVDPMRDWVTNRGLLVFPALAWWLGYWYIMASIFRSLEQEIGKSALVHSRTR